MKYKQNVTGDYTIVYTSSTSVTVQVLVSCNAEYSVSVAAISSVGNMSKFSAVTKFHTVIPAAEMTGETNHHNHALE